MDSPDNGAAQAAEAWTELRGRPLRALPGGLINGTWAAGDPPCAVLQRQHRLFPPRVTEDIEAVTAHVARGGLETPLLLRTRTGSTFHQDGSGACWRALTWVHGRTVSRMEGPEMATSAGDIVARWHAVTSDLAWEFRHVRPGAHDTDAHMARLSSALEDHRGHRLWDRVAPLAGELLSAWGAWSGRRDGRPRVAHGDLKISNVRFDLRGRGICLIDFDTLSMLPIDVELGDAARSWCNPAGEDCTGASLDPALFEAAFEGYLRQNPLPSEDREAIAASVERICLELAARFAADALAESYFGWNPAVAPGRGEHNLLRALGQASLACSVRANRGRLERALLCGPRGGPTGRG